MIKAIIFDWDGVIYDTLRVQLLSERDYLKFYGIKLNEQFRKVTGKEFTLNNYKDFISELNHYSQFYSKLHPQEVWNEDLANKIFLNNVEQSFVFPEMNELLNNLKSKGYKIGLVTLNFKELIKQKISFNFDYAVYNKDVKNHKPDPEGLNLCLKRLNVKPENALFIGDMPTDGQAARNAGMSFIGVSWGLGTINSLAKYGEVVNEVETLKNIILSYN